MKLRGKETYIITGVVAVVLVVAWYFLLFSPKRQELSDAGSRIDSARSTLSTVTQDVARLESYKKAAPQSRAEIVRLGKMLPESVGLPGLVVELGKSEAQSGVTIIEISPAAPTVGKPFGTESVVVKVVGRYFDIEDFLYRIEQYVAFRSASFRVTGRLLHISSLIMYVPSQVPPLVKIVPGSSPPVQAEITFVGYTWGGMAPAAATTETATPAATEGAQ